MKSKSDFRRHISGICLRDTLRRLHLKIGRKTVPPTFRALADGPACWFLSIEQRDVTHIFSRIDVDKSKDQPNRDPVTDLTHQKWILGLDAIWRF